MEKKYFIRTFGCQANKSDSQRIAGDYEARGWTEVSDWKVADNIIINTCAVRQRAEDRVLGFLKNIVDYYKRDKPKIILTGCMIHHGKTKLLDTLPMVDEILPINEVGFNQQVVRKDKLHAWVPISSGCNSFCTYCIVPYARGREVSRPAIDIMQEVKKLAKSGYREITLLGQNVNSWGLEKIGIGYRKILMHKSNPLKLKDIPSNQSQYKTNNQKLPFVTLLRRLSNIKEIKIIRFMTSNPWDFQDELIDEIASNKKIDRFIHLPVQSGSNKILRLMNRGYTRQDYLGLINKLKKKIPGIQLGTDIIVGFPGETDKDFNDTVNLAGQVKWNIAFVAKYSPRPGTASHKLYEDSVSAQIKKKRWEILDDLINKSNLENRPIIK